MKMYFIDKFILFIKILKNINNWYVYFLDFLKLYPYSKEIIYKLKSGVKYIIRSGKADRWIFNEVVLRKVYLPKELKLTPDSIILDIGAHLGTFTVLAAKMCPNGKIYAFEPNPENFTILTKNIKLNNLKNVEPIKKAVGDKTGKRIFFINPADSDRHTIVKNCTVNEKEFIRIESISLSDFINEKKLDRIDLLKVDCEGCEYELFNKENIETLKYIKQIIMEVHSWNIKCNKQNMINFLEEKIFQVYVKESKDIIYALNKALNKI